MCTLSFKKGMYLDPTWLFNTESYDHWQPLPVFGTAALKWEAATATNTGGDVKLDHSLTVEEAVSD